MRNYLAQRPQDQQRPLLASCPPSFLSLRSVYTNCGGLPGLFQLRPASELTSDSSHGTSQSCQQKSNHQLNRKGKGQRGNDQMEALCWVWDTDVPQPHWPSGAFQPYWNLSEFSCESRRQGSLASVSIPILDARTTNGVPTDSAGYPSDLCASSEGISHLRQDWVG